MDAIEIDRVTKVFGETRAVDDLTLSVREGAVYGFIGPNGSGKTTTMRMIVNILYPDEGTVRIFGEERAGGRSPHIGYLPEERGLYRRMEVRALLEFHGELRGGRSVTREVNAWLSRLDLAHCAERKVETLSKGMSQKVQFIAAVVPEPKLLILDEPFSGLDPVSAETMRAAILEMRDRGATVILSTHDMHVAETFCDSILMIYKGRKVLDGTLAAIQEQYGNDTISISRRWRRGDVERVAGRREGPGPRTGAGVAHGARLRPAGGAASPAGAHARQQFFDYQALAARHLRADRGAGSGGGPPCVEFCWSRSAIIWRRSGRRRS
jgi:ABC-2 type transport system ATP-binding protein